MLARTREMVSLPGARNLPDQPSQCAPRRAKQLLRRLAGPFADLGRRGVLRRDRAAGKAQNQGQGVDPATESARIGYPGELLEERVHTGVAHSNGHRRD